MKQVILNEIMANKSYPEAGETFYSVLRDTIMDEDKVQIDMSGVESIPTMFMTTSFGRIMSEYGVEKLKKAMIFRNITKVQIERIGKYMNDYAEVYHVTK